MAETATEVRLAPSGVLNAPVPVKLKRWLIRRLFVGAEELVELEPDKIAEAFALAIIDCSYDDLALRRRYYGHVPDWIRALFTDEQTATAVLAAWSTCLPALPTP